MSFSVDDCSHASGPEFHLQRAVGELEMKFWTTSVRTIVYRKANCGTVFSPNIKVDNFTNIRKKIAYCAVIKMWPFLSFEDVTKQ